MIAYRQNNHLIHSPPIFMPAMLSLLFSRNRVRQNQVALPRIADRSATRSLADEPHLSLLAHQVAADGRHSAEGRAAAI